MRQTSETHISGTDDGSVLVGDDRHEMPARTSKAVKSGPRGHLAFGQASEPVRRKVESGEAVVIPWSALLFRRRADVDGRDPPHLRPEGPAVPD
jgi:hypothetical protein